MLAQLSLRQMCRKHLDRRLLQNTRLLTQAAAGTGFGMHDGYKHCVFARTRIVLIVERNGITPDRTDVEAYFAAQTEKGDTGLLVHHHRETHTCIIDVG